MPKRDSAIEGPAKMEESQLKITELLEMMKIAKSNDGKACLMKNDESPLGTSTIITKE